MERTKMKPGIVSISAILLGGIVWTSAQSEFNIEEYQQFLQDN